MVSVGAIYEKIIEVADMIGASLIVMGTDGDELNCLLPPVTLNMKYSLVQST